MLVVLSTANCFSSPAYLFFETLELGYFHIAAHVLQIRHKEINREQAKAWLENFRLITNDEYFGVICRLLNMRNIDESNLDDDEEFLQQLGVIVAGSVKRVLEEASSPDSKRQKSSDDEEEDEEEESAEKEEADDEEETQESEKEEEEEEEEEDDDNSSKKSTDSKQ